MKRTILTAAALALLAGTAAAADRTLATVNGEKITAEDLTKKLWWQHAAQGLTDLVDERLVLQEAARLGLKADEKEVAARYAALEAGTQDKAAFERNLKSVGWSPDELRGLLRRQMLMRAAVMAAKKIAVTDEDAKAFFEKNKDRLGASEAVKLSQIYVNTKAEADDAYDLLTNVGADFAKLSALKSADASLKKNGGALGYISRGMLQPEIEKEVFALKAGQYTKPMQTGAGFSIFRADEIRQGQPASYEKVQNDIKTALLNQAVTQKLPELAAELRQKAKIAVTK